jgi:hypothetical protein
MAFVRNALGILGVKGNNEENLRILEPHLNRLVPFVGAGLSVEFGYPGWANSSERQPTSSGSVRK